MKKNKTNSHLAPLIKTRDHFASAKIKLNNQQRHFLWAKQSKLSVRNLWSILLVVLCLIDCVLCKDYYELLGVDKDATNRDIRRAFKKLALSHHPDKNQDDLKAHEKFLEINKAYEILKDQELRKKYDMHGEEGLKDDFHGGRKYESWNFYNQNFGIYDEDPEIVSLSHSDFEQAIGDEDQIWFINFYSVHCGHCHDLAPTWREVAKELDGVIRIGAVNCQEEWMVCQQQGIGSYPTLILYPQRERFPVGKPSKWDLMKFALKKVTSPVHELWSDNFKSKMEDKTISKQAWLITFCGDGGDCLLQDTCKKLAAVMLGLVNIGNIDCHSDDKLCNKLGIEYGTYFFQPGKVKKNKGLVISSLEYKEVAFKVLEELPDVKNLDKKSFKDARKKVERGDDKAWLIHFVDNDSSDIELRKLPALLKDINVGRVDCRIQRTECNQLHVHKFPTFAVFKQGGGYEIQHGRSTAHDVASFARDSSVTPVRVLSPSDFPHPVSSSNQPWFVDFYAPWCPPCMRLLPEFRKASKSMPLVSFGTVDCTVHGSLCQKYNVHSYPTTVFYNQSVPHQYHGHHNAEHMLEFLKDTLQPPVTILNPDTYIQHLKQKEAKKIWLVDYFAPWCGPCQQLAPEWRKLAKMFKDNSDIHVAQVDCQAHHSLCQMEGVHSYPTIRLYPTGSTNTQFFHLYNGWMHDASNLHSWVHEFLPSAVTKLDWNSFHNQVLQSSHPWVIDFYAPWCGPCKIFAPEFERVGQSLEGQVKAGKVDCQAEGSFCQQVGITSYPTVRLYEGALPDMEQNWFGEDIHQNADHIISILRKKFSKQDAVKDHDEL